MIEFIVAPIAESENDSISDTEKPENEMKEEIKLRRSYSDPLEISLDSTLCTSLEDLISNFDEKIFQCFQNFSTDPTEIVPLSESKEILKNQIWWQNSSFEEENNINESIRNWNELTDLPDKNKYNNNQVQDSPSLKSAEGLLMEIHEMMDYSDNNVEFEGIEESFYDSDLSETFKDAVVLFQSDWLNKEGTDKWKNALKSLNNEALKILINDMKGRVRTLSDCLLIHLAIRDELEFEREVRDRFMLLLQGVQKRKREIARNLLNQRNKPVELRQRSRWIWNGNWGSIFRNQRSKAEDIQLQELYQTKLNDQKKNKQNNDNNNHNNNNNNNNINNNNNNNVYNGNIKPAPFVRNQNRKTISSSSTFRIMQFDSSKRSCPNLKSTNRSLDTTIKYLSTTIPFKSGISSTNIHHLQIFNKILLAILQENSKLDKILTDYLLNVYTSPIDENKRHFQSDNCNNNQAEGTCQ